MRLGIENFYIIAVDKCATPVAINQFFFFKKVRQSNRIKRNIIFSKERKKEQQTCALKYETRIYIPIGKKLNGQTLIFHYI